MCDKLISKVFYSVEFNLNPKVIQLKVSIDAISHVYIMLCLDILKDILYILLGAAFIMLLISSLHFEIVNGAGKNLFSTGYIQKYIRIRDTYLFQTKQATFLCTGRAFSSLLMSNMKGFQFYAQICSLSISHISTSANSITKQSIYFA